MTMRAHICSVMLLAAACGDGTPSEPTWADVQPILMANCARCHGGEDPIGGGPATFRLDLPYGTSKADAQLQVYGAAVMADFVVARACEEPTMPPIGPKLSGRQCEILARWAASHPDPGGGLPWIPSNSCGFDGDPFNLCTRAGNTAPTASLISPEPGTQVGPFALLTVFVHDADRDQVAGTLRWGPGEEGVIGPLHGGRNEVPWFARRVPDGTWSITAQINDVDPVFNSTIDYDLGAFVVANAAGPTPHVSFAPTRVDPGDPTISAAPLLDQVVADADSPFTIRFHVSDSTPATLARMGPITAVRGDERIEILAAPQPIVPGLTFQSVTWDTSAVTAGEWRIEVTVDDGDPATLDRYFSERFWVFHGTTTVGCGEIEDILEDNCATCHKPDSAHPIPNGPDFTLPLCADALRLRGTIYRRVIQKREMPPQSQGVLFGEAPLPLAERATLQEWIEGGTP